MIPKLSSKWPMALLLIAFTVPNKQSYAQTGKAAKAVLIKSELIMDKPPFRSSHASSITELPNGRLLATWFGGTDEGNKDVCIWTAERKNGKWAPPVQVADGIIDAQTRYPCWNPVLLTTATGKILLFYKVGPSPAKWWGEMKYSTDNGQSWSKAEKLPEGILGPIKNKPIQLANGDILHPSSWESVKGKIWKIHVEKSDSTGHNWTKTDIDCGSFGVIQPSILTYPDGRMQMINRSLQKVIVQTWSDDNGKTWSPLTALHVKNPNSGIDGVTLKNGLQVMVYNPTVDGKGSDGRDILNVAVSKDGENWTDVYELENVPKGEFSYPAIIQGKNGHLYITYTHNRRNVTFAELRLPKTK